MTTKEEIQPRRIGRRQFIKEAGALAGGAASLLVFGCGPDGEPKENFEEARILIENLPEGKEEAYLQDAFPQNLVVRRGSEMTVVGTVKDQNGAESIVCLITDPLRKTPDGTLQTFNGILPGPSLGSILSANGGAYDSQKGIVVLPDGKKGRIQELDSAAFESEKAKAGVFFVDRDPLKKDHPLLEKPVISIPDKSTLPEGGSITQLEDGRVVAKDAVGNIIARAISQRGIEWRWTKKDFFVNEHTLRELFDALDLRFTAPVYSYLGGKRNLPNIINDTEYRELTSNIINEVMIGGELQMWRVFEGYSADTWRKLIDNWDTIKAQLDSNTLPSGFSYNWTQAERVLDFANRLNIPVRMHNLLWGGDVPDTIINGNFSPGDIEKILEFTTKSRMIKYKARIPSWVVASEAVNSMLYHKNDKWTFWYDKGNGKEIIFKVAQWAHEADPEAKLMLVEDHILESTFLKPRQLDTFMTLLKELKFRNIPLHGIIIENNFWTYDPPNKQHMLEILQRIKELGFEIETPETTVAISDVYPSWPSRPKVRNIGDPISAQDQIYKETLEAYLQIKARGFGVGDWGDRYSWHIDTGHPEAKAMLFDENNQPKSAYYTLLNVLKQTLARAA